MKQLSKDEMVELIKQKLINRKSAPLTKRFKFTTEYIQDNPTKCIQEMLDYLMYYQNKIEDFDIEISFDEVTISPIINLRLSTSFVDTSKEQVCERIVANFDEHIKTLEDRDYNDKVLQEKILKPKQ